MSFDEVQRIADAVFFEGYLLYPYRPSSLKNQYRWTFGVLVPPAFADASAGTGEASSLQAQVLVSPQSDAATLEGRLRFMQLERRLANDHEPPHELGVPHEVCFAVALASGGALIPFEVAPARQDHGSERRERGGIVGEISVTLEEIFAQAPLVRVTVRITNQTPLAPHARTRSEALTHACLSTHLLLGTTNAQFVSLLDPPPWAREAALGCRNIGTYPVLVGDERRRDRLLAAPFILYDFPRTAPESPGDFFDATEIDELLTLRTAMLTDDEKRQARASDPRAAAIIDRVEHLPAELLERMHGAVRELAAGEMVPRREARRFAPGMRVRIKASPRRTDAQDILFVGATATVEAVRTDLHGRVYVAVTLENDPAAEAQRQRGFHRYYAPDGLEPLGMAP